MLRHNFVRRNAQFLRRNRANQMFDASVDDVWVSAHGCIDQGEVAYDYFPGCRRYDAWERQTGEGAYGILVLH